MQSTSIAPQAFFGLYDIFSANAHPLPESITRFVANLVVENDSFASLEPRLTHELCAIPGDFYRAKLLCSLWQGAVELIALEKQSLHFERTPLLLKIHDWSKNALRLLSRCALEPALERSSEVDQYLSDSCLRTYLSLYEVHVIYIDPSGQEASHKPHADDIYSHVGELRGEIRFPSFPGLVVDISRELKAFSKIGRYVAV